MLALMETTSTITSVEAVTAAIPSVLSLATSAIGFITSEPLLCLCLAFWVTKKSFGLFRAGKKTVG